MNKVISFVIGAAIGGAATFIFLKRQIEKKAYAKADDEIKSMKEEFIWTPKCNNTKTSKEDKHSGRYAWSESSVVDETAKESINYNTVSKKQPEDIHTKTSDIEVIKPDDFGEAFSDNEVPYMTDELFLYEDGVIADRENQMMKNPERSLGKDFLKTFGKYEDDASYIRNHKLAMDFAVYKRSMTWSELKKKQAVYEDDD